ncbi:hypothetical protein WA026_016762 [Henosepilachna vigintioctopunctata]|uniref:acid phosphatase n=1 Tax=Henosepilachna vigintioctopunctata TaxID=420089 RepID=A0AAW1UZZ7_9CUCU
MARILLMLILVAVTNCAASNLLSVVLVYRHGDRIPKGFALKDIYQDRTYWASEPGELTNIGKNQHYNLGKWLRNRYNNFLPATYHKSDIYVRSTSADRCLMSAAVNLAGLYPPVNSQVWNSEIKWMPIPIHSLPAKDDGLLKMGKACPEFELKYKRLLRNENFTKIDQSNAELYQFLSENLGKKIERFSDIELHYDTMRIEAEHHLKLPEWTNKVLSNGNKVFPEEMKKWADLAYETPTYNFELARLSTGIFLDTLASQFEGTVNNDTLKKLADKMVMFSAHKSTLSAITHTLGVFRLAPFAGALFFELRSDLNNGKIYVNTLFKTENDLEHLQISGCEVNCDFKKFLNIIKPYRMMEKQWKSECLSVASEITLSKISFLSLIYIIWFNMFS